MTEPIKPEVTDLEALRSALQRVTDASPDPTYVGDGLWLRDIVRATYRGPRTLALAEAMLASDQARQLLARAWTEECPPAAAIDAAVASPTASRDDRLLARHTHELLTTLHAVTCDQCRHRLQVLGLEVSTMEDPDFVVRRWTLLPTSTTMATVRGAGIRTEVAPDSSSPTSATFSVDSPELYDTLVAVQMREPVYPSLTVRRHGDTVTVRLVIAGGLSPTVRTVTAYLTTSDGEVSIPLDLSPREEADVEFTGSVLLPPGTTLDLGSIDLEAN